MFPLPYKHVWTLSYIYRVLISPIDEFSGQRNNKTKPKHINFPCCEQWLRRGEPEDGKILFSTTPRCGHATPWRGPLLRRGVSTPQRRTLTTCPDLHDFTHFFQKSNQKQKKTHTLCRKTSPKYVLTQPIQIIEIN